VENARKLHGLVQVAEDTTEPDFSQLVASALTYESRVTFLQRSRQIVDGLGTDRIVEYLSIVEN